MENKEDKKDEKNKDPSILSYSGLGLQTVLIIGLGAYSGSLVDAKYQFETNWFTLSFVLVSVAISMAYTIRVLNKWNSK
jgi:1,4-dihydroxy-2-naphthoate octaprenyltransferase|tara:strand:- start:400 stop:636 length:237 start_codon:yes stop_codon:yes gene_type:complete